MVAQIACANCKQIISADEQFFGKTVKCPKCQAHLRIPDPNAPAAEPADPMVGRKIAHYEIEALLGRGGMGKVYRARHTKLNRTCAIKVLPEEFARQDKANTDRFIREAQSAANVEHPNVLPVYAVDNEGETYYIEMQFVDGGTLDGILGKQGKLKPAVAAKIARDVAAGLAAAHGKGIIHRDIKPSNVMVTKDGQVKVADFGLARMGQMTTKLTVSGMIMGTPLYMSPEQAQGLQLDHRADIYSLGVMLYQLLTGTPPYTADTPLPLLNKHVNDPIPDIRQVLPEIQPELAAIVTRMMAKKPEDRYQSCTEVVKDLNAVLSSAGAPAQISESTREKAAELRRPARAGEARSQTGLYVAIGVAVVAVAVAVGMFIGQRRQEQPVRAPRAPRPPVKAPVGDDQDDKPDKRPYTQVANVGKSPMDLLQQQARETRLAESAPTLATKARQADPAKAEADKADAEVAEKSKRATVPAEVTVLARGEAPKQPHETASSRQGVTRSDNGKQKQEPEAKSQSAKGKAEDEAAQSKIQNQKSRMDLMAYLADIKPVDDLIDAADYTNARARAVLMRDKHPRLIDAKIANLDRITALRTRCFERVNTGKVKLDMGDISRKHAIVGEIKKADDTGLTGKIQKKWDCFSAEEVRTFYQKASDPDSADDLLAIAALLMEGNVDEASLDAALIPLVKAKEKGADVAALVQYVATLKPARAKHTGK